MLDWENAGSAKLLSVGYSLRAPELLFRKIDDAEVDEQIEKLKFCDEQDIFSDPLNESSVDTLIKTGNFKGQISCCECGESGCSSEYLWAEGNFGLASFHILAAELRAVRLYSFKLV